MNEPELIFIVGPNAAGKSSFIRTRINELNGCEIIMTDVYKSRSKEVFAQALAVSLERTPILWVSTNQYFPFIMKMNYSILKNLLTIHSEIIV